MSELSDDNQSYEGTESELGDDSGQPQPDLPAEDLIDVEITWNQDAENVSVYCSYDNFRIPVALEQKIIKTKKGKDKKIFRGMLQLPAGTHLLRYQVDGEWHCDDKRDIIYSRGFEYNSLIVHKEESEDDEGDLKSPPTESDTSSGRASESASEADKSSSNSSSAPGSGAASPPQLASSPETPVPKKKKKKKSIGKRKKL